MMAAPVTIATNFDAGRRWRYSNPISGSQLRVGTSSFMTLAETGSDF
jgi:hypothetical protein